MKIRVINPDWGMTEKQMQDRCAYLQKYVSEDTVIEMECLTKTRVYLDTVADAVLAGPEILEMAVRAEAEGADAIVLYCFSDPAMEACRQMVSIPVVGAGQSACLLIPVLGYQGVILIADEQRIPEKMVSFYRMGLETDRIAGFEAVQAHGLDPFKNREQMLEALAAAGKRALQKDGATVLVLGCLSFLGVAQELSERLQIPVIDPATHAVATAEILARQHLKNSQLAYYRKNKI